VKLFKSLTRSDIANARKTGIGTIEMPIRKKWKKLVTISPSLLND